VAVKLPKNPSSISVVGGATVVNFEDSTLVTFVDNLPLLDLNLDS